MMDDGQLLQQIVRIQGTLRLEESRVEVEDGVVYLEGIVESAGQKHTLEQAVRRLPGVAGVVNCLAVEHVTPAQGYRLPQCPLLPTIH